MSLLFRWKQDNLARAEGTDAPKVICRLVFMLFAMWPSHFYIKESDFCMFHLVFTMCQGDLTLCEAVLMHCYTRVKVIIPWVASSNRQNLRRYNSFKAKLCLSKTFYLSGVDFMLRKADCTCVPACFSSFYAWVDGLYLTRVRIVFFLYVPQTIFRECLANDWSTNCLCWMVASFNKQN